MCVNALNILNIYNVVPDPYKGSTVMYKKFLGGVLIALRRQIFAYLKQLEKGKPSHALIEEILSFLEKNLAITPPAEYHEDESRLAAWVQQKLNRPIRVCGMVRNVGEPGGARRGYLPPNPRKQPDRPNQGGSKSLL